MNNYQVTRGLDHLYNSELLALLKALKSLNLNDQSNLEIDSRLSKKSEKFNEPLDDDDKHVVYVIKSDIIKQLNFNSKNGDFNKR